MAQKLEIKQTQVIGSVIGEELRDDGGLGMLAALAIVMLYVAIRFQFKFSLGAVAALIHDVLIVLGFFSFFKLEFDLTVLAAVLAVIGYSLNDTIVVSDRIRENFPPAAQGLAGRCDQRIPDPDPGADLDYLVDHFAGVAGAVLSWVAR